jgi:uncharacterized membrane protein
MWLWYTLIAVITISFANLFQKLSMKKEDNDPIVASIIFQVLLGIFSGIFALIVGFKLPPVNLLPYFAFSILFYGFGTIFFFRAMKAIEVSRVTILAGFGSLVSIVSGFIFLGERLSMIQMSGAFFILLAVYNIEKGKKTVKFSRGVVYSLLGTSLYALAITNDTFIISRYEAISYTPIMSFLPAFVIAFLYPKTVSKNKNMFLNLDKNLVIYSFLYSIQAVAYYLALQYGAMASRMNTIFKSEIVLTIILATILLKERKDLSRKIVSAILVTIGVVLLR